MIIKSFFDTNLMVRHLYETIAYGVIIGTSIFLRLFQLSERAMHHDESLHSFYSWQLAQGNGLTHNPMMHGPLQMELTAGVFFLFGDSDFTARLIYVIAGSALTLIPLIFREWLGREGAIITAIMLSVSPSLLYFSRFARNDILMAVFTFVIIMLVWDYLKKGSNRRLYWIAGLMALSFCTKESAFLVTGMIGLYCIAIYITQIGFQSLPLINLRTDSYPVIYKTFSGSIVDSIRAGISITTIPRSASMAIFLIALTLPQWAAVTGIIQHTFLFNWTNLILVGEVGNIGMPVGGGKVIAFLATSILFGLSAYLGYKWCWRIWWRSTLLFYAIWLTAYTTFFTNIGGGISSGLWQSLGYWIVQQGEARGDQPFFYYLIITPTYEYLPLITSVLAATYYIRRKNKFGIYLAYWCLSTFILYTIASEKMPWLLVNIALPMIVLSGQFLGSLVNKINWSKALRPRQLFLFFVGPVTMISFGFIVLTLPDYKTDTTLLIPIAITILLGYLCHLILRRSNSTTIQSSLALLCIGSGLFLLILTIRTSIEASFKNSDIPVEMMVYTQTSPDLKLTMKSIDALADQMKPDKSPQITIDQTSGFTWPWTWYLRNYEKVDYPVFSDSNKPSASETNVVLVHSRNKDASDKAYSRDFHPPIRVPHRWWFPEHKYRDIDFLKFTSGIVSMKSWKELTQYWLFRQGVAEEIGSEDAYLYVREDHPDINFVTDKIRHGP